MATINRYFQNRKLHFLLAGLVSVLLAFAWLSPAQQPVLTIAPLGNNQFNIIVTNGVTTTNYTLFWTPVLQNSNYPWIVLAAGDVGQTNFIVDGGNWNFGFFRVMPGIDSDGDGIPEWQDAQPQNPAVGILRVTIDSPLNGTVLE